MWNKKYKQCVCCNTTHNKHMAKGLCSKCYLRKYRNNPNNKSKIAATKHLWYVKHGKESYSKKSREQRYFDNNREKVLARDGYACTTCGTTSSLVVHHIDGNGRGSLTVNNKLNNLITLCRSCHARLHATAKTWAMNYTECICCGSTTNKHNAKGFCTKCYQKEYNKQKR